MVASETKNGYGFRCSTTFEIWRVLGLRVKREREREREGEREKERESV